MSKQAKATAPRPPCPICGAPAEPGFLTSDTLQWLQGEPGSWKATLSLGGQVGTIATNGQMNLVGIRCHACRRFILEDSSPQ
jgi:hypothetical protein